MTWLSRLSDEDIERALDGEHAGDDAFLDDLAAFARDAEATLRSVPGGAIRETHLAAMSEAAADLQGDPVATRAAATSLNPLRRWKLVLTHLLASLGAKVALAGVAVAAATGGLAATGSLPEPAQIALANAAEKAGFELPTGDMRDEDGPPEDLPDGAEGSPAQAVLEVIRNWEGDKGCEFGHAVAEAAGGNPEPCKDEADGDRGEGGRPDDAGKPEGTPDGRPEGAGKPEGTPEGRPDGAGEDTSGKPAGTPGEKPEGAGKPEGTPGGGNDTGAPDDAGSGDSGSGGGGSGGGGAGDSGSGGGGSGGGGAGDSGSGGGGSGGGGSGGGGAGDSGAGDSGAGDSGAGGASGELPDPAGEGKLESVPGGKP